MDRQQRTSIAVGVVLILAGIVFLAFRLIPSLNFMIDYSWPLIVIGAGLALLVIGLVVGAPDMAIPAFIVAGTGGILYWQNMTGHWGSWAYLWTLYPGFVGLGIITAGIIAGRGMHAIWRGIGGLFSTIILFLIFGSFFGAFTGLGAYWPLLLVAAGLLLLARAFLDRKH